MLKKISIKGIVLGLVMAFGFMGSVQAQTVQVNGAGATFPYPLYSKWFYEYNKQFPNIQFNYQSIGSGGGIKQITERTVDFGASDAPMSDEAITKIKDAGGDILHIPTAMGAVVLAYNVPEAGANLKLTGPVVADIFMGKITKWNDPKIQQLNTDKKLPATDIMVTHRSDGSGTTYIFTDYLSKVSPDWKKTVGKDKSVNWPVGLGGKGNEGVTGLIQQTPNSIGYVELNFAIQNKLPYASLQNKNGKFIIPTLEAVTAAAAGSSIPADYRVSITDAPGDAAYPISSFTYLLVYKTQGDPVKGKALVDFLKWSQHDGQKLSSSLNYSALPADLVTRVDATISKIQVRK